ncbi:MAG TPA: AI-2E family transporter [Rhodocyclaceae bacterium]|nr:AI-2E family transporter [Rhodocyclaceae bacterium]
MTPERADRLQTLIWSVLGLAILWLLFLLGPILSPFLLAGILAYICAPLVERLDKLGLPRLAGVIAVMLLLTAILALLLLILLPLVNQEAQQLLARLPDGIRLLNEQLMPWLKERFGIQLKLDPTTLPRLIADNRDSSQLIAQKLLASLKIGGIALFGIVANLLLAPVVMFYLLRDWHELLSRLAAAIPRPWHAKTLAMAHEINAVLAEFLRGQLSVMLALALYYSVGLWAVGIGFALPVGMLTGLLVFIPYLGFATGFILALAVAALQFSGMAPIVGVLAVYGVGQGLESFILTPWLVGKRIGLHPLAVIFALLAFGQLFGFFGVLLALPVSAALLVGLREVRALYLESRLYRGEDHS